VLGAVLFRPDGQVDSTGIELRRNGRAHDLRPSARELPCEPTPVFAVCGAAIYTGSASTTASSCTTRTSTWPGAPAGSAGAAGRCRARVLPGYMMALRQLPGALRKRARIAASRRVSPREIRGWIRG